MKTLTAAIQFGSKQISAAAAWIHDNGAYEVIALERTNSDGCIHHGCVVSADEVAVRIKNLMLKLNNRCKNQGAGQLDAAYIGICGISMHSMEYRPAALMGEDMQVTHEVLRQLEEQSMQLKVQGYDILGLQNNGTYVSDQQAIGQHQLILAEHRLLQGFHAAMERAHLRIAGVFATPLLLGDMLQPEEKQEGCLLLDLGAHLTTISIYKDGALQFLTVIPLGCDCITQDIATKGLRMEEAEDLKVNWSNAARSDEGIQNSPAMPNQVSLKELNLIVTSRYEEIAINIANQIEKAGFKGQLAGGCVLTGGGSLQKGLTALLSKRLEISRISTRSCNKIQYSSSERKPSLASMMSMLAHCTESCQMVVVEKPAPAPVAPKPQPVSEPIIPPRKKTGTGLRDFLGDLFSGLDEN